MHEKEIIRLDARVTDVIADAVFRAELRNGHRMVAYAAQDTRGRIGMLQPGDRVTVEMSPFDMSRGRIVDWQTAEVRNEGS